MTEMTKTLVFAGTAVVVLALTFLTRPQTADLDVDSLAGELFTGEEFDVTDAKRIRIVKYNEETAEGSEFEVAQVSGSWRIPSKNDYPADGEQQMGQAASEIAQRRILRVQSKDSGDHAQLGVLDPTSSEFEAGDRGVGTRVTFYDEGGKVLVDMIVGDQVKGEEDQHYVRHTEQDAVYVLELDPSKFSTNFEDWIEKDLLKLSPWDIQKVHIDDYSFEVATALDLRTGQIIAREDYDRRSKMTLAYDDGESKWNPESLLVFDAAQGEEGQYVERTLGENEELNTQALNDLKNALDDLKIVDVVKKPAGLSQDLKTTEDFVRSSEAANDLVQKGFVPWPVEGQQGGYEIRSSEGEVIVTMKTGVEYVLRFGELREDQTTADTTGEEESGDGIHRYLFVTTRLNEQAIAKPELEEVPPLPAGVDPSVEDDATSDETTSDAATSDATSDQSSEAEDAEQAAAPDAEAADREAQASTAAEAGNEASTAAEADNEASTADAAAESDPEAEKQEAQSGEDELEAIIQQRKTIREENKRKEDAYDDKLKEGREKVNELNDRFGDWYYVIANDVYNNVHLGLDQVVKEKEAEEGDAAGAGADATSGIDALDATLELNGNPDTGSPDNDSPNTDSSSTEATDAAAQDDGAAEDDAASTAADAVEEAASAEEGSRDGDQTPPENAGQQPEAQTDQATEASETGAENQTPPS